MRRILALSTVLALCIPMAWAADKGEKAEKDTPAAAATRKKLKQKVTVDFDNSRLAEVTEDLEGQVKGLHFRLDAAGGVSQNQTFTYKAENKPVDEVLDAMFKKRNLGYVVISKTRNAYDGTVLIRQGSERGYPKEEK